MSSLHDVMHRLNVHLFDLDKIDDELATEIELAIESDEARGKTSLFHFSARELIEAR